MIGEALFLAAAAFAAGALNTVAGGGTFLTLPALVAVCIPPVAANATSAVAVFPGYLGGAMGFLPEMRSFDRPLLLRLTGVTLLGGLAGSLLLVSSDAAFSVIVPFLLLLATGTFFFGDRLRAIAARHSRGVTPYAAPGLFAVSLYGGYFNGSLGIVLLALFSLWGMTDLHRMNGLKNLLSFALSAKGRDLRHRVAGGMAPGGGHDGGRDPWRIPGRAAGPADAEAADRLQRPGH